MIHPIHPAKANSRTNASRIAVVAPAMDGVKAAIDVVDSAVSGLIGALGGYAMARALPRGGNPEA